MHEISSMWNTWSMKVSCRGTGTKHSGNREQLSGWILLVSSKMTNSAVFERCMFLKEQLYNSNYENLGASETVIGPLGGWSAAARLAPWTKLVAYLRIYLFMYSVFVVSVPCAARTHCSGCVVLCYLPQPHIPRHALRSGKQYSCKWTSAIGCYLIKHPNHLVLWLGWLTDKLALMNHTKINGRINPFGARKCLPLLH